MSTLIFLLMTEKDNSSALPHIALGEIPADGDTQSETNEVVETFIHQDAEKLRSTFKQAYEKFYSTMQRPHVLIVGAAGAGKRSVHII